MHFYPNERIALFIDGANLYATAKSLGFDIDFKRLLALFCSKGQLVRALYYTALTEDQEYSSLRPLIGWLGCNGFTVVTSKSSRSSRICTATLAPLAAARARLACTRQQGADLSRRPQLVKDDLNLCARRIRSCPCGYIET